MADWSVASLKQAARWWQTTLFPPKKSSSLNGITQSVESNNKKTVSTFAIFFSSGIVNFSINSLEISFYAFRHIVAVVNQ